MSMNTKRKKKKRQKADGQMVIVHTQQLLSCQSARQLAAAAAAGGRFKWGMANWSSWKCSTLTKSEKWELENTQENPHIL